MYRISKYLILGYFLLIGSRSFSQKSTTPLFKFGVIADVQYANRENHGTRHYRSSLNKLEKAVTVFNEEKVDFVVSLGDFINDDFKSFDTLTSITGKLNMRLYHVIGNHDFSVRDDKKDKILQKLNLRKEYYSFEKENWRFIVLNGDDISLIANAEGSLKYEKAKEIFDKLKAVGAPNAKPWNGTLSKQQLNWLKKQLSISQKKKQNVIVLCHFPLYPDGSAKILWNSSVIRNIIEAYPNVSAYLNGHVHVSQYFLENNINYVSFKGMVEKEENAFAIISVFKDYLEIKGYGKEVDRILR